MLHDPATSFAFEHEDWHAFRDIEGLQRRAGVAADKLPKLTLKELCDNGLDTQANVGVGQLPRGGYFVEDDGPGLDGEPEDIAKLYSINRHLMTTKLLRRPSRGALGNGLRVVAGAVLASEGHLTVTTRDKRIQLRPERDGSTTVVSVKPAKFPVGTRVEIAFGRELPSDRSAMSWANEACAIARNGERYTGKTSPHWYDLAALRKLIDASGNRPVRDLMALFDGDAGKIVAAAGLDQAICSAVTKEQAAKLLRVARAKTKAIDPAALGFLGREAFLHYDEVGGRALRAYARMYGHAEIGGAEIPFVVEAWARSAPAIDTSLNVFVNRTPVTGDIHASRDKREINVFGCGLAHNIAKAPKDEDFEIQLSIITPYMPITSDGKEPDFTPFRAVIQSAVGQAVHKAHKPKPESDANSLLPKSRRGRRSREQEAVYREKVETFCKHILQIHSRLDFGVGSRDYCYLLEEHGLPKGDFDNAEKLITACRKSGDLPLDICAEDASREAVGLETIDDCKTVLAKVDALINHLLAHAPGAYLPICFWDTLGVYIEVATEKLSLRNLFEPVCVEFHIPVTNFKGWSDLNARAAMMRRFKYWHARGKKCILLLCGDHDPGGLFINKKMRENLEDLAGAVGWSPSPENLDIRRFGLNADFIDDNHLTWINNLETSSGGHLDDEDHNDHNKEYVQSYLAMMTARYGADLAVRKCEANSLVIVPNLGRQLCRDAILEHIDMATVQRYERRLARARKQLKKALAERIG
jgi:hypothetical protein